MPMTCTVCRHEDRREIDRNIVLGTPLRDIAGRFGLSKSAVHLHKQEHVPKLVTGSQKAQETLASIDVGQRLVQYDAVLSGLADDPDVRPGDRAQLVKAHLLVMEKARDWGVELPDQVRYAIRLEMNPAVGDE